MGECTYRQLQQERVQLLIGQSILQIQEQSTLGTMQQSSLQHYSVLGSLLGNCMEIVRKLLGWYIGWAVRITARKGDFRNLCSTISRSMQTIARKGITYGRLQALLG